MRQASRSWFIVDWNCSLGGGGEGEVFLGRALPSSELCAVKVSASIDPDEAKQQLKKELDRCLRARGRGVVGLVAWNLDVERPFLVFELARAGTLADEMKKLSQRGQVYHPTEALKRTRSMLVALRSVHARGMVHRDVKPANLLRFESALKLTDFGTGRTLDRPSAVDTEAFVGTRMYAAPEQLRGEEVDERADLYAVGCILCEMITGEVPSPLGVRRSLARRPDALILPDLEQLMSSLLQVDKSRRPASAEEAVRRVDRALGAYAKARRVWQQLRLGDSPY